MPAATDWDPDPELRGHLGAGAIRRHTLPDAGDGWLCADRRLWRRHENAGAATARHVSADVGAARRHRARGERGGLIRCPGEGAEGGGAWHGDFQEVWPGAQGAAGTADGDHGHRAEVYRLRRGARWPILGSSELCGRCVLPLGPAVQVLRLFHRAHLWAGGSREARQIGVGVQDLAVAAPRRHLFCGAAASWLQCLQRRCVVVVAAAAARLAGENDRDLRYVIAQLLLPRSAPLSGGRARILGLPRQAAGCACRVIWHRIAPLLPLSARSEASRAAWADDPSPVLWGG
mmetsp:Transcript_39125/g.101414  ORF Transcript_39125/g.101414 Transcript_39125/m.101414 type:complete len:289 (+) Transcript_39125:350-1216(+)